MDHQKGSGYSVLLDANGNTITSNPDAAGNYYLGSSIIQSILTSTGNSTTNNLASGVTFTGVSEETFGINGIQTYHFADQDCTISVEQSLDNTNWDISDSFECLANNACTRTFTSVAPYFRLKITNDGDSTTTVIRAAAGMTPIINPLPRALTDDDRLKSESTLTGRENTDRHVWVAPNNALRTESDVRLVGTIFDGTNKDTNFWTEAVTGSGSATQAGEIELSTGTTADSTTQYNSVRTARFVAGSALSCNGQCKFVTAGTTNNVRRVGAYNNTDGFFFQLDGTTFSVGYRKASSDTLVNSGSFNGNYGPNYVMDTAYHKLTVEWTTKGVFFYIDNVLLHKDGQGHRSNFLSLPIRFENNNSGGLDTDIVFDVLGIAIIRQGPLSTNSQYYHISGNAATHILKYGPGVLHKIIFNNTSGTSITIYDNTSAAAPVIGVITTTSGAIGEWSYDLPFSTGLTLVTVGNSLDATVVYE